MAVTVRIRNFQAIRDATIKIDGLTVLSGVNNSGKALRNGTLVSTPSGWIPVQELKVGNKVFAGHGGATTISGVYPQGIRDIWKVGFDDGREVFVDGEHLWKVSIGQRRFPGKNQPQRWETLTTSSIREQVGEKPSGFMRPAIPIAGPVQYPHVDSPIDPYLLGVLLGDGCLRKDSTKIATADDEILREIKRSLPEGLSIRHSHRKGRKSYDYRLAGKSNTPNPITEECKRLGLCVKSFEKFVPTQYKHNDVKVRLAVLQGLLDTDGGVDKNGGVKFYTTSLRLATDVAEIVHSMGGKTRWRQKVPFYKYRGEKRIGRTCFILCIRLLGFQLFRLQRKLDRVRTPVRRNNPLMVSITASEAMECTCIAVKDPSSLFQIEGHIVTHNTAAMRAIKGVFTNTPGHSFVRHGAEKCIVEIDFEDGNYVRWEKGEKIKPLYIVNGKKIHPGRGVPDEVKALGVVPIEAAGKEIWPQMADQFTGTVFLLDQPGSVLAESIADVERVGHLNRALMESERDKRAAASKLKLRREDETACRDELKGFEGLDDVVSLMKEISVSEKDVQRVERGVKGVCDLRDRLRSAQALVGLLSKIDGILIPPSAEVKSVVGLQQSLLEAFSLRERYNQAVVDVRSTEAIKSIELPAATIGIELESLDAEIRFLQGLFGRFQKANSATTRLKNLSVVAHSVDEIETTLQQKQVRALEVLCKFRDERDAAQTQIVKFEKDLVFKEAALRTAHQEAEEILAKFPVCPTCNRPMGADDDDHTSLED
jgi:hypothetical protein